MSAVYLDHLARSLGSISQTVEAAGAANQLVSPVAALRESGFTSHHVCAPGETAYDLAARALRASNIDASAIDAIVYSTCLPQNGSDSDTDKYAATGDVKFLMQFPASRLQAEFGMERAIVIGLNQQACTGMLGALRLARNLLQTEAVFSQILCVTADRFPAGAKYEQAYNLISDGGAACIVSREQGGMRLLDVHQISNGAMVAASDDETVGSYFNYTCRLVEETLQRCATSLEDIRWVVPQNTNRKAWRILAGLLGLTEAQAFFPSMQSTGHVISADNIINLAELQQCGELKTGDRILTFMAGFGSNWQSAVLEAA